MNACFMKEPSTSLFDMGKTSCQKSTLTEKLRAESTLYTVLSSPLKSVRSPSPPLRCGSPVIPGMWGGRGGGDDGGGAPGGGEGEGGGGEGEGGGGEGGGGEGGGLVTGGGGEGEGGGGEGDVVAANGALGQSPGVAQSAPLNSCWVPQTHWLIVAVCQAQPGTAWQLHSDPHT